MLKKTRVVLAIIVLAVISFYFIDFTGLLSNHIHWLTKIQLIPALLALNIGVLLFLTVLTLLLGRVYCSVICPMGIFQDVFTWVSLRTGKKKRKKGFKYSKAKPVLRYLVLGISLVSFFLGFTIVLAVVEPYSAFGRISTHLFKPVYMAGNNLLTSMTESSGNYWFYRTDLFIQSLVALILAAITFLVIGFLAWKYGRTWCNTICPAGTLLGLLSKHSLYKVRINNDLCSGCGLCEKKCKASCISSKEKMVDNSRCVACYNCLESCKRDAITYSLPFGKQVTAKDKKVLTPLGNTDESRRQFFATAVAAALVAPKMLAQEQRNEVLTLFTDQKSYKKQLPLSPPGSLSHTHLSQQCTSCHLCINRCPGKILKPALLDYGWGGVMQPVMKFEENFCEAECTVCADVCPNGAIKPLTVEKKMRTQVGRAVFVPDNCIVNSQHISCGACARNCPVEAITMTSSSVGFEIPSVDTKKCIGCGACEYICPVLPYRGIYVDGNAVHTLSSSIK